MSEEEPPKVGPQDVKPRPKKKPKVEKPEPDEIDQALAASKITERKAKDRKTLIKRGAIGAGVLILGFIIYLLFAPFKGTMAFGLCKVFVELNVQYPTTLKLNSVEEFSTSVRIWYTHTDSFGEYILEPIQCYFRPDENFGFALDKVTIRRRELDESIVEAFNRSIPVILENPPDLTLPQPPADDLKNIQVDLSRLLKPIL